MIALPARCMLLVIPALAIWFCIIEPKLRLLSIMWEQTLVFPSRRNRLTNGLYLFYIALFVFVLPFACWDADDGPQHPHARPQLVFMLSALSPQATDTGVNVDPESVGNPESLAVTGVVLLGLTTGIWLPQIPHFGFVATLFPLIFAAPYFALELPPPRSTSSSIVLSQL